MDLFFNLQTLFPLLLCLLIAQAVWWRGAS
jgi:hypothetical protein